MLASAAAMRSAVNQDPSHDGIQDFSQPPDAGEIADCAMGPLSRAILLIDEQPLRREAYLSLLTPWAVEHKLTIRTQDLSSDPLGGEDLALVVICVGSRSVTELQLRGETDDGRYRSSPTVIISDVEHPAEIAAALQLGARGYLPTLLSSPLALRALTFVMSGGEFFPASALQPPDA